MGSSCSFFEFVNEKCNSPEQLYKWVRKNPDIMYALITGFKLHLTKQQNIGNIRRISANPPNPDKKKEEFKKIFEENINKLKNKNDSEIGNYSSKSEEEKRRIMEEIVKILGAIQKHLIHLNRNNDTLSSDEVKNLNGIENFSNIRPVREIGVIKEKVKEIKEKVKEIDEKNKGGNKIPNEVLNHKYDQLVEFSNFLWDSGDLNGLENTFQNFIRIYKEIEKGLSNEQKNHFNQIKAFAENKIRELKQKRHVAFHEPINIPQKNVSIPTAKIEKVNYFNEYEDQAQVPDSDGYFYQFVKDDDRFTIWRTKDLSSDKFKEMGEITGRIFPSICSFSDQLSDFSYYFLQDNIIRDPEDFFSDMLNFSKYPCLEEGYDVVNRRLVKAMGGYFKNSKPETKLKIFEDENIEELFSEEIYRKIFINLVNTLQKISLDDNTDFEGLEFLHKYPDRVRKFILKSATYHNMNEKGIAIRVGQKSPGSLANVQGFQLGLVLYPGES